MPSQPCLLLARDDCTPDDTDTQHACQVRIASERARLAATRVRPGDAAALAVEAVYGQPVHAGTSLEELLRRPHVHYQYALQFAMQLPCILLQEMGWSFRAGQLILNVHCETCGGTAGVLCLQDSPVETVVGTVFHH